MRERAERLEVVRGVDGFERALRRRIDVNLRGVEVGGGSRQREKAEDGCGAKSADKAKRLPDRSWGCKAPSGAV